VNTSIPIWRLAYSQHQTAIALSANQKPDRLFPYQTEIAPQNPPNLIAYSLNTKQRSPFCISLGILNSFL
jgi:hypothetical protein